MNDDIYMLYQAKALLSSLKPSESRSLESIEARIMESINLIEDYLTTRDQINFAKRFENELKKLDKEK